MNVTYLGLLAGAATSAATIPQVVKSYRTRNVRDISIWQPVLLDIGIGLWLVYGLLIGDVPLVLANTFSIVCNSMLIYMKIAYGNGDRTCANDYIGKKNISTEEI
jgi:MtN3 and saliva related transmembrane protein